MSKVKLEDCKNGKYNLQVDGDYNDYVQFIKCYNVPKTIFYIEYEQINQEDDIPTLNMNIGQLVNTKFLSKETNELIRKDLGLKSLEQIKQEFESNNK